ncbi:hypothetical protein ACH36K_14365 [Clostridium sp. MB05]
MEEIQEKKKLGAGIITISILYFIGLGFTLLGSIINLLFKDQTNKILAETGTGVQVTTAQILITLITSAIIIISVVLILCRKSIGVILFFATQILSIVYGAITVGINIYTPLNLLFPGLMAFFIYKKKDIYFIKE